MQLKPFNDILNERDDIAWFNNESGDFDTGVALLISDLRVWAKRADGLRCNLDVRDVHIDGDQS